VKLGQEPVGLILDVISHHFHPKDRSPCVRLMHDERERFAKAWGSSFNHQAWPSGYLDHVAAVLQIAIELWPVMMGLGPLLFDLDDALLPLFLHDLEKPWKAVPGEPRPDFVSWKDKAERHAFRMARIRGYGIVLSAEQENAIKYVEGEGDNYSGRARTMNDLAAFCHMCDVASARIWHSVGYYAPKAGPEEVSLGRATTGPPDYEASAPLRHEVFVLDPSRRHIAIPIKGAERARSEAWNTTIKADPSMPSDEIAIESGGKRTTFKIGPDGKPEKKS